MVLTLPALERRFPFAAQKITSHPRDSFRNTRRHVYIRCCWTVTNGDGGRMAARNLKIYASRSDRDNSKKKEGNY